MKAGSGAQVDKECPAFTGVVVQREEEEHAALVKVGASMEGSVALWRQRVVVGGGHSGQEGHPERGWIEGGRKNYCRKIATKP